MLNAQDNFPFVPESPSFPDVPSNHWARKSVQQLKDEGILVGYPSGLMNPVRLDSSRVNLERVFSDLAVACAVSTPWRDRNGVLTRYEAAVTLNAAIESWAYKLELIRTDKIVNGHRVRPHDLEPYWVRRKDIFEWLEELQPELRSLGLEQTYLRMKLRSSDRATREFVSQKRL